MSRPKGAGRRGGFTLIELMIVIAIISILASIMIPNMVRSRDQSKLSACKQNLRNIATAVETYALDNDGRYPTALWITEPDYLKSVPSCPVSRTAQNYHDGYQSQTLPSSFTVMCRGTNHLSLGLPQNFPQYTSDAGLKTE